MTLKIESARLVDGKSLPEKIWFKQQVAIRVNDVTHVLERMASTARASSLAGKAAAACIQLQAVVIASDCNPRWLSKHLPTLALSGKVPVIFLKDNKGAFLRLGQLLKLKTAIAIGVKAKGNAINLLFEEILSGNIMQLGVGTEGLNSSQMLTTTQGEVQRGASYACRCWRQRL
ncbi:uncharacterized protein [Pyrus communis]|uniref:uncharacterized protein n=1 Tax=Pyrus communis TaxID=23211 RepID=UPI0035C02ECA